MSDPHLPEPAPGDEREKPLGRSCTRRLTVRLAWLLAAALPVFFVALGANTIWDANEAFYVETPRQMVETGDYVTPRFNDADRVNKPVLSYWIVAGLYQVFGVSVAVERVGIALGALGIVLAAFLVGRAMRSTTTGLLAAVIVATAPRVVMHSRRIFIDVYLTLFMSLTLACFALAERHPRHRRTWLLAMYVCLGLGTLTKGPIALVIPALAGAAWMTMERRWSDLGRLHLVSGILIVLAIVAPWYVALYLRHGWDPVVGFFLGENVDRYLSSMVPGDSRPVWFYLPVLLSDLFPWAPLVLVPLALDWRRPPGSEPEGGHGLRRLLWWWIVCTVGLFSLSETKQDLYIFPVTVAAAVLIADAIVESGYGGRRRSVAILLGVGAALTAAGGPLVWALAGSGAFALDGVAGAAIALGVGGVLALVALLRRRGLDAVFVLAATWIVFNYLFVLRVLPWYERFKPMSAFADTIAQRGTPGDQVGAFHFMQPSLVYYVNRPVRELATTDQLRAFYAAGPAWVVMTPDRLREVVPDVPGICVGDRRPVFGGRLDELIDAEPGEVLLVTNQCED